MKKDKDKNSFFSRITHNVKIRFQWLQENFKKNLQNIKENCFIKKSNNSWVPLMIPYVILMILLIVAPLFILLLYALISPTNDVLIFDFTINNFKSFFYEQSFLASLRRSLLYATVATFFAILIGYPVAYLMAFSKSKLVSKNIWILVTLPIWINMLVKTIGLKTMFDLIERITNVHLLGTPIAIVIGMIYMFIPFVIIPIFNSLDKMDRSWIEASKDLGASPYQTFWRITFRYSMPGIITGIIFMLLQAATSLIVVKYMGQEKITLISSIIEAYFFQGANFGLAAAISVFLGFIILLLVIVLRLLGKRIYGKVGRNND
ncbi:spermidine/putrescine ABC transporter permease [Spiroplasma endosymbiont of Eupeodes luniger]|uniref:spermidine/putrescine ABC transporter permease n=1 Tax=Spiroplasma endosymbiont of Eupeodes luniger TaxID=3066300 RepID=UPI0030CE94A3